MNSLAEMNEVIKMVEAPKYNPGCVYYEFKVFLQYGEREIEEGTYFTVIDLEDHPFFSVFDHIRALCFELFSTHSAALIEEEDQNSVYVTVGPCSDSDTYRFHYSELPVSGEMAVAA